MSNAPQDIIKTALDILTGPDREVELALSDVSGGYVRYGTLTGLSGQGDGAYVTITGYRAERNGDVIADYTLVGIDEIISISPA